MPSAAEVGRRLKEVRREKAMTLKQVADSSGMSPTHISEIERGKTSPTVGALRKIAHALGKDTAFFVEDRPLPRVSVVKKEDREDLLLPSADETFVNAKGLTNGIPAGRVTAVLIEDKKGAALTPDNKEGEEALIVLQGAATVTVGKESFDLEPGDCLHYAARSKHSLTFTAEGKNRALWVRVKPGAIRW
ncbi:MAG: helix-turn-helix domain-containing protein [Candidatus Eisenbacteria bacterium]|nr:helix-turn-helix domain-containing protein [Candidatus Eisenbacteria bacterium]